MHNTRMHYLPYPPQLASVRGNLDEGYQSRHQSGRSEFVPTYEDKYYDDYPSLRGGRSYHHYPPRPRDSYRSTPEIPKTTIPFTRRLDRKSFQHSPWCPRHSHTYRQSLETNQHPYAIDCLDDSSDGNPWSEHTTGYGRSPNDRKQTIQPTTSSALGASRQPPRWIRLNSKPILDFLASCSYSHTDSTIPGDSLVIPYPYKVLFEYEPYIRRHFEQLQQDRHLKNLLPNPPGEEEEPGAHLDPDPKNTKIESDDEGARQTSQHGNATIQKEENLPELETALADFRCLTSFLDETIKPKHEAYRHALHPKISFDDLWFLFRPGDEVFDTSLQSQRAPLTASRWEALLEAERPPLWKVVHLASGTPQFPQTVRMSFVVEAFYIDHDGSGFIPVSCKFHIQPFEGEQNIQFLGLFPLRYHSNHEEVRAGIFSEGRQFLDYSTLGPAYRNYKGGKAGYHYKRVRSSEPAATKEEIDVQVMVDFKKASELGMCPQRSLSPWMRPPEAGFVPRRRRLWDSVVECECNRSLNDVELEKARYESALKPHGFLSRCREFPPDSGIDGAALADEELILLPRYVPALVLPDRHGILSWTKGLTSVEKDETLWSDLRLSTGQGTLLLAQAEACFRTPGRRALANLFGKSGRGTGKGRAILLQGPGGVGRSSAVRALSAKLSRPLVRIDGNTCTTDGECTSKYLAQGFEEAEKWLSVLVIEEADTLVHTLESISGLHLLLHQLDNYGGFVVLTATSIECFDDAFKSRIHLTLFFPYFSKLQALDVWKTKMRRLQEQLGEELQVHEEQVMGIFHRLWETESTKMTGRHIENTFRSAVSLAECEADRDAQLQITLGAQHFHVVIEATLEPERAAIEVPKPKRPVDVEKQCGVLLPSGSMCARSLTCKSHSMVAKRAVSGRSLPFDMLLAQYQKKKQAKEQLATIEASAPLADDFDNYRPIDSDEEKDAVVSSTYLCPPQQLRQLKSGPALIKAQSSALTPTDQSHSAPPHHAFSPQSAKTEEAIKALSRALCEDESIRELLLGLSSYNTSPLYFVTVVERFIGLLGRDLANESDHGSGTQLVKENTGRLAHFMWNHISSPEPLPTEALGTLQKDTLFAFPALFESDALGFFKEDLLEFVKVGGEARKRDMSVDSFLGRGIALEEPFLPDDPSGTFFSTLKGFFTEIGLLEPQLRQGYRRVRWKCRCGASLYDDFSDRMPPDAMHDLILRIRRLTSRSNSPTGGIRGFFRTPSPSALGTFTLKSNRSSPEPTIPLFNTPETGNVKPDQPNSPPKDPLYLLLCMNDGRYASGLRQKEIQGLKYDRELFQALQDTYRAKRGRTHSLVSLRAVQSVEFVAFTLMLGHFVDVRRHERHCNDGQSCNCLPPPEKVSPNASAEYSYQPVPPNRSPPIGPNAMTHFLQHPECIHERQTWILKQFPKKLRGKLVPQLDAPVTGWGIYFNEGRNRKKILALIVVNLVAIFVFGVAWSVVQQDISGGFAVVASWISVWAVFLGYIDVSSV